MSAENVPAHGRKRTIARPQERFLLVVAGRRSEKQLFQAASPLYDVIVTVTEEQQ